MLTQEKPTEHVPDLHLPNAHRPAVALQPDRCPLHPSATGPCDCCRPGWSAVVRRHGGSAQLVPPGKALDLRELIGAEHFTAPEPVIRAKAPPTPYDDTRLYAIGKLATLLKVKPESVRKWTVSGDFPAPTHSTAGIGAAAKRRYTESQVMGLVALWGELGCTVRTWRRTDFPARARELFADLAEISAHPDTQEN
jgi:hypothetical protein